MKRGVLLVAILMHTGCTLTVLSAPQQSAQSAGSPEVDFPYNDDHREEQTCRDRYDDQRNLAAYHQRTAMNDEVREFWAEDQRFYEQQADQRCDL